MTPVPSARRERVLLAALAMAVAALTASGATARATYGARTTADEPHYLMTAISLAEDRDLDIADERAELRYLDFHALALPQQAVVQADGRQVAPHDPLLAVLLAVPVALGGWVGAKLALAAMAGVLAALIAWTAIHRFAVRPTVACATSAVACLSPPLAMYATQVYPELPAALAGTAAVAAITGRPSRANVVGAGLAIVALPWLSVKYLAPAAALAGLAVVRWWRARGTRAVVALVGGLAVAGVTYLVAHQAWYGGWTAYAAGSHFRGGELTVVGSPDHLGRSVRLVGLLTDRDFGLLVWQPAWVVAVPALAALARRRPPGAAALALPLAAGWLVASFVALTMHGWWWPGRQVVVVLPLAVLAVAWWLERLVGGDVALGSAARRCALVGIGALGAAGIVAFACLVIESATGRLTWVLDPVRTLDPVVRALRPVLPDLRDAGIGTTLRQLAWSIALAALAVAGWRTAAPFAGPSPGAPADAPARVAA